MLARSDPDSNQTMTGARQHAEQRLKGGTVSLRLVSRQLTTAALSLLVALLVAAPAAHAASPQVVHEQTIRFEGTYTVTFQDPSLGVQEGRFGDSEIVHATPGGTFTFSFINNERLGEVRIHETVTFVVSADGTIRVQNETFDFSGCPSV